MLNSKVKACDDTKVVRLEGRIDMSNAEKFEELMLSDIDRFKKMELDLGGLTFIDSTGVGHLVSVIKNSHKKNVVFQMTNVPEGIEQILEIIGVFDVLNALYGSKLAR